MSSYLTRRLVYAVITFFGVTLAVFTLIHSVPGDPVAFYIGTRGGVNTMSHEALDATRHEFHLDRPLAEQYLWWLRGLVTFDMGLSISDHRPVTERIAEKLPATLELNVVAFLLASLIGIPIGLWSATRSGRPSERGVALFTFILYSLPSFWVALLLMELFAMRLDWFPLFGIVSDNYRDLSSAAQLLDRLKHLALPVITLTYAQVAIFARFSKAAVAEVIRQDFITTARAKGVSQRVALLRHALRNALLPLITLLALTVPYLLSGSVIVEQIFQWDGIGRLYLLAIISRDYPLVLALTMATAVVTLLAGIAADILYALADPRIRLAGGRR